MTTFSIGRVGVAVGDGGDGLTLPDTFSWQQQGRTVNLAGRYLANSRANAVFFVNQIDGLDPVNNPDETAIPIYSFAVPEISGWYTISSANATIPPGSLGTSGTMIVEWQVSAVRAAAWRRPMIEVPTAYGGLVNGWGLTSTDLIESAPGTNVNWTTTTATSTTRTGERGVVNIGYLAGYAPVWPGAGYATARHAVSFAEYYRAGAYIEDTTTGLTYVGRADSAAPSLIRIGNGLIRMAFDNSTSLLTFQWWDGAAWAAGRSFNVTFGYGLAITAAATIVNATILKNAPDECIIRIAGFWSLSNCTVDVSIRRGDRVARIFTTGSGSGAQLAAQGTVACTSKSYGQRVTATTNSEYIVMTSDRLATRDLVNGSLSVGSGAYPMFGLGVSLGGGTGTGINDADGVGKQLFAVYGTTQRAVIN